MGRAVLAVDCSIFQPTVFSGPSHNAVFIVGLFLQQAMVFVIYGPAQVPHIEDI